MNLKILKVTNIKVGIQKWSLCDKQLKFVLKKAINLRNYLSRNAMIKKKEREKGRKI